MVLTAGHPPLTQPRVVIAHDFLETYGGAERIIAEAAAEFPGAPFWAILGRRAVAERMGIADRFHTVLPESPWLLRNYRWLAPIFPALVAAQRLPDADVLLSSSYAYAHGFRTRNRAPHVCYCYSPLRFAWSMTDDYAEEIPGGAIGRTGLRTFARAARRMDRRAAREVGRYLTESEYTADQIRRFYGREADAIGAPVDCSRFHPGSEGHDGYYLFCGRLVEPYKRASVAIRAFASLPEERLIVTGTGPALPALRAQATSNVEFVGHLTDDRLIPLMQRCAAAIFPSRDDFGIVPVEVMACGRPVLAFGGGGAVHTVEDGVTGNFFDAQTPEAVVKAVREFDPDAFDSSVIRSHAERWDSPHFRRAIRQAVLTAANGALPPSPNGAAPHFVGVSTTSSPPSSS